MDLENDIDREGEFFADTRDVRLKVLIRTNPSAALKYVCMLYLPCDLDMVLEAVAERGAARPGQVVELWLRKLGPDRRTLDVLRVRAVV